MCLTLTINKEFNFYLNSPQCSECLSDREYFLVCEVREYNFFTVSKQALGEREREELHFWVRVLVDLEWKKSLFLSLFHRD